MATVIEQYIECNDCKVRERVFGSLTGARNYLATKGWSSFRPRGNTPFDYCPPCTTRRAREQAERYGVTERDNG